jgi:hypothetical protein
MGRAWTIRAVRERNPDARIIVVSGAGGDPTPDPPFRDAKQLGAKLSETTI